MKDFLKNIFSKQDKPPPGKNTDQRISLNIQELENLIDAKKLTFANENLRAEFAKHYSKNQFENLISHGVQSPKITVKNPRK